MKINILTGISLFLCVTLQGTQNEDQENKDLLILDTFLINKYDRNKIQNVNCRDQWGKTPLTFESTEGNEENVKFLLENGAKHNLLGENLIEGTTKVGIYEDKKVFFVYPTTALNEASKNGHKGCMQLLIKYGAKPFKINKYYHM